jgi:hypothetical protein
MGWLGGQKAKYSSLGLSKTSIECDGNLKIIMKRC